MPGLLKFVQETPRIAKRKPIRVFVEPRLDRLVVVRTEPHEPRLIGRAVGYWRLGGAHQWRNTLVRSMRIRKRPRILHIVSFENCHAMWVAYRASERWWKHNIMLPTWSARFSHSTGFTRRAFRVDCDGVAITHRKCIAEQLSWRDVRHLRINPSGNKWTFTLYTGIRLSVDQPGGSVKTALRHITDC